MKVLFIYDVSIFYPFLFSLFCTSIGKGRPLGLPIGRHVSVRAKIGENNVMRAYTPCSSPYQVGYFEILLKAYEMGKMSTYLHSLQGMYLYLRSNCLHTYIYIDIIDSKVSHIFNRYLSFVFMYALCVWGGGIYFVGTNQSSG